MQDIARHWQQVPYANKFRVPWARAKPGRGGHPLPQQIPHLPQEAYRVHEPTEEALKSIIVTLKIQDNANLSDDERLFLIDGIA